MIRHEGRVFKFGDDINTDYIISSRRKKDTLDPDLLRQYLMEDIRPGFSRELAGESVLAAGENFGCGSAMEVAAQLLPASGIWVVLAKSFARSYYRNAINNGILIVEMDTDGVAQGDTVRVSLEEAGILVEDLTNGLVLRRPGFRKELTEILESGGLIGYVRRQQQREEIEG